MEFSDIDSEHESEQTDEFDKSFSSDGEDIESDFDRLDDELDEQKQSPEDIFWKDKPPKHKLVSDSERMTKPRLTKFEFVRIIETRITQIKNGAAPMVDIPPEKSHNVRYIVKKEFKEGKVPIKLKRHLPEDKDGNIPVETWKISELKQNFI